MIRLSWFRITSDHIFRALDAILKKCCGLLKTKYDEKCDNFGDFGTPGFVNTTQFQESIVTVHQSGGVTQKYFSQKVLVFYLAFGTCCMALFRKYCNKL